MRITFHIGAGKTGTSAIQTALRDSRQVLSANGIYIPPANLQPDGVVQGWHVFQFEQIKRLPLNEAQRTIATRIPALVEAAEKSGHHHMVFSAENLSNPHPWASVLGDALEPHDVDVVMYVRRQDDFLLSGWQQWGLRNGTTFDEWLLQHLGRFGDWRVPVEEWQKLTDRQGMRIRIYERPRLANDDVVDDFFAQLEFDPEWISKPDALVNASYSIAVEELLLDSGHIFDGAHDNDFFKFLDRVGINAHKKRSDESRLTFRERRLILNRYNESNRWIRETYFADSPDNIPELLFRAPRADAPGPPAESDTMKRQLALLLELVYGVDAEKRKRK